MGLTDKHLAYGDDIPADINSYRRGNSEGYTEGYNKGYSDAQKKYERPKGEWKSGEICFSCGKIPHTDHRGAINVGYHFCPYCGAEMLEAVTNEHNQNISN